MSQSYSVRFAIRLAAVLLCGPGQAALAGMGGPDDPIEVILPFDMQAGFFHSLPIAGLMVTPDQVAQLVLTNPRLRVTTGLPFSGMGTAVPVREPVVADTHADPMD